MQTLTKVRTFKIWNLICLFHPLNVQCRSFYCPLSLAAHRLWSQLRVAQMFTSPWLLTLSTALCGTRTLRRSSHTKVVEVKKNLALFGCLGYLQLAHSSRNLFHFKRSSDVSKKLILCFSMHTVKHISPTDARKTNVHSSRWKWLRIFIRYIILACVITGFCFSPVEMLVELFASVDYFSTLLLTFHVCARCKREAETLPLNCFEDVWQRTNLYLLLNWSRNSLKSVGRKSETLYIFFDHNHTSSTLNCNYRCSASTHKRVHDRTADWAVQRSQHT